MHPLTIRYAVRPVRRSLATGHVADLFGLAHDQPPHTVADGIRLDVRPGDLVLFTGPSGSGKSSLLRAVASQLPDVPLVDALGGPVEGRLKVLAACGLSEARLLLRTPGELSDGQRYRFRLAYALGARNDKRAFLLADEFAANLDRTLAKVLAFNLRKMVTRTGVGALLATTHEDVIADLRPDLHVRCLGDGDVRPVRDDHAREPRPISFADELRVEVGSRRDWPAFARWHYRSHHLGFVKRVVLLKHGAEMVGICVFATPAAGLAARSRFFGLRGPRTRLALDALNAQLWVLSRVVLHPTYRGAGIAADFVRRACRTCPVPWVETLTAMGHANPVFERAGFVRAGVVRKAGNPRRFGGQFGRRVALTRETVEKSRYSEPVYYVFDNRDRS
jgi:ABC-type ATPase with predicted acetyltransferase domain